MLLLGSFSSNQAGYTAFFHQVRMQIRKFLYHSFLVTTCLLLIIPLTSAQIPEGFTLVYSSKVDITESIFGAEMKPSPT